MGWTDQVRRRVHGPGRLRRLRGLRRPRAAAAATGVSALEQIRTADDAREATVEIEPGASATAHWSEELGTTVVVTDGLENPGQEKASENWFVRGESPASADPIIVTATA